MLNQIEKKFLCRTVARAVGGDNRLVAELLGVTEGLISQWKNPRTVPPTACRLWELMLAADTAEFIRGLLAASGLGDDYRLVVKESAGTGRRLPVAEALAGLFEAAGRFSEAVRLAKAGEDLTGDGVFDRRDVEKVRGLLEELRRMLADFEPVLDELEAAGDFTKAR